MKPQIIINSQPGYHNQDMQKSAQRLLQGRTYQDLSTVCVIPTRGVIPAKVVDTWWAMMPPMNQKFIRMMISGMEVGDAYNSAINTILSNPELSKFKYMLTLEEDNTPPPDGLLKLYEGMETYAAIGGLYWTKGEGGQPMIYGNPQGMLNFVPQVPVMDGLQECNGLGMGFTLFNLDLFRDERIEQPWFKTEQTYTPGQGARAYTQDLWFFEKIRKLGYRVACDTRVKVGHYDLERDQVW